MTEYDDAVCVICGKALSWSGSGRKPTRCDLHKTTRQNQSKIDVKRSNAAVSKILIILTMVIAYRQLRSAGIFSEKLEEDLAFTDEEADAVAKPIARWAANSQMGAKVLRPLVDNDDLVDAGVAIFEYHRRTSKIWAQIRAEMRSVPIESAKEPRQPSRLVPTNGNITVPIEV